jgi:hypothetical protein
MLSVALASLVMAGTAWLLRGWHPLAASALAGGVYLALLGVTDADFRQLGSLVLRRLPLFQQNRP